MNHMKISFKLISNNDLCSLVKVWRDLPKNKDRKNLLQNSTTISMFVIINCIDRQTFFFYKHNVSFGAINLRVKLFNSFTSLFFHYFCSAYYHYMSNTENIPDTIGFHWDFGIIRWWEINTSYWFCSVINKVRDKYALPMSMRSCHVTYLIYVPFGCHREVGYVMSCTYFCISDIYGCHHIWLLL